MGNLQHSTTTTVMCRRGQKHYGWMKWEMGYTLNIYRHYNIQLPPSLFLNIHVSTQWLLNNGPGSCTVSPYQGELRVPSQDLYHPIIGLVCIVKTPCVGSKARQIHCSSQIPYIWKLSPWQIFISKMFIFPSPGLYLGGAGRREASPYYCTLCRV